MRQGTIFLVSAVSVTLLLAGCAAETEQQFNPDPDCAGENCGRASDTGNPSEQVDGPEGGGY